MRISGGCHCGAVSVLWHASAAPAACAPRACDCVFCRQHGAGWFSDRNGRAHVEAKPGDALARYRQGDGLADFLLCGRCGVVVAVVIEGPASQLLGALNAGGFPSTRFAGRVDTSPQQLDPASKITRWQSLWMPVTLSTADSVCQSDELA